MTGSWQAKGHIAGGFLREMATRGRARSGSSPGGDPLCINVCASRQVDPIEGWLS
jgi:hypothetical protein